MSVWRPNPFRDTNPPNCVKPFKVGEFYDMYEKMYGRLVSGFMPTHV